MKLKKAKRKIKDNNIRDNLKGNNIKKDYIDFKVSEKNKLKFAPNEICFLKEVTVDSYAEHFSEFKFIAFKSLNNIFYLVYSTKNRSIILYDIINNTKISEIKNAHSSDINYFLHFLDEVNKKEYIISCSFKDNNLKSWDLTNLECILNLNNINNQGGLRTVCVLKENKNNFIITSNSMYLNTISDPIKVFDFKGNKLKEIDNSNESTFFIDTYYDYKSSTNYIITANVDCAKSYIFNQNKLYRKYYNITKDENHSLKIDNSEEILKLIVACGDGYIRIWNFHSAVLLKSINCKDYLNCLCLWDKEYIFVGCDKKVIKLVNLKSGEIIKELSGHNNYLMDIKKTIHPIYVECLLSQGYHDDQIKLWVIPK